MAVTRSTSHATARKMGRHTTVTSAALPLVNVAKKDPRIKKVVLGQITPVSYALPRVKFTEENPVCLRAQIRGRGDIQIIWFHLVSAQDKDPVVLDLTARLRP